MRWPGRKPFDKRVERDPKWTEHECFRHGKAKPRHRHDTARSSWTRCRIWTGHSCRRRMRCGASLNSAAAPCECEREMRMRYYCPCRLVRRYLMVIPQMLNCETAARLHTCRKRLPRRRAVSMQGQLKTLLQSHSHSHHRRHLSGGGYHFHVPFGAIVHVDPLRSFRVVGALWSTPIFPSAR